MRTHTLWAAAGLFCASLLCVSTAEVCRCSATSAKRQATCRTDRADSRFLPERRFRMKRLTHKPKFSFATNFSWWFGSPETRLTAG